MSEKDVIKINAIFSILCTEIILFALNIITNFEHSELGFLALLVAIGMVLLTVFF